MKPKEKVPPFTYEVDDRERNVINPEILRHYIANFWIDRKKKIPKNYLNLPNSVVLEVLKDEKIKPLHLPTQRELKAGERIQSRREKLLKSGFRRIQRKMKKNRHGKPRVA